MAAPAFASYTVTVDNSLTLNTPTGAASGDLLLVIFQSDGNSDFDAGSNGFIAGGRLYSGIDCTTEWFYLPLNSAPASSYTFTRTGGGACRGWMIRITGANLSSPIDVSGFQEDTASNTAHDLPALTTTVADTLLIAASLVSSGAGYTSGEFTPPSGYTEISETGTVWCHVSTAWKTQATAGSTGSASFTGVSAQSLQLLIAVKPAGGTTYTQGFSSALGVSSTAAKRDATTKTASLPLASATTKRNITVRLLVLPFAAALARSSARGIGAALGLASMAVRGAARSVGASLAFTSAFASVKAFLKTFSVSFPLSASVSRTMRSNLLNSLSLATNFARSTWRSLDILLAAKSAFGVIRTYTRALAVGLNLNTALIRFIRRDFAISLALTSNLFRSLRRGLAVLFGLSIAFFRQISGMTSQSPTIVDHTDSNFVRVDVVTHTIPSDRIGLQVHTDAINL